VQFLPAEQGLWLQGIVNHMMTILKTMHKETSYYIRTLTPQTRSDHSNKKELSISLLTNTIPSTLILLNPRLSNKCAKTNKLNQLSELFLFRIDCEPHDA
jgi:hypothetical protein